MSKKKRKKYKWSFFENGSPGLHLIVNPQPALTPQANIYHAFLDHGIPLTSAELQSLLAGRDQGVATLSNVLGAVSPGLAPDTRLTLSGEIADALLNRSLQGQLSREHPNALERFDQQDELLQHVLAPTTDQGLVSGLMRKVTPGVSLTIHFWWNGS